MSKMNGKEVANTFLLNGFFKTAKESPNNADHLYTVRGKYQMILSPGPCIRVFSVFENETKKNVFWCSFGSNKSVEEYGSEFDLYKLMTALGIVSVPRKFFLWRWLGMEKLEYREHIMTTEPVIS